MENNHGTLPELMSSTIGKIREMVDVNTIVGESITTPDGTTIIPVSRMSFGFGSGGSEFGTAKNFGGGGGAGAKIVPIAFLIVNEHGVKLLPVNQPAGNTVDRVVDMVPTVFEKIEKFLAKRKEE